MTTKKNNDVPITDVTSYLQNIFNLKTNENRIKCYRGQADIAWKLEPSIMRDLKPNSEHKILSELFLEVPSEFNSDKLMFERLVRAQHYSLPTRLLDVTFNPLVALYFSCHNEEHFNKDGAVFTFDFSEERTKYADSDTISIISNLSRVSDKEKETILRWIVDEKNNTGIHQALWNQSQKDKFRALPEIQRLMQFIRIEKSYFLDISEPADLFKYLLVYPLKTNRRVIAQSGAFITAGALSYKNINQTLVSKKLIIPSSSKENIIEQLDTLNINSQTLFPEIESTAKYIKNKWKK